MRSMASFKEGWYDGRCVCDLMKPTEYNSATSRSLYPALLLAPKFLEPTWV